MPIYQLAHYQVKASGVDKVRRAIDAFVRYLQANEPGTEVYLAWQQQDDPTRFVHIFKFADERAMEIHSKSDQVRQFEVEYTPELVSNAWTSSITTGSRASSERCPQS